MSKLDPGPSLPIRETPQNLCFGYRVIAAPNQRQLPWEVICLFFSSFFVPRKRSVQAKFGKWIPTPHSFNLRKMKYSWLDGSRAHPGGHSGDKDDVLWRGKVIISYLRGVALCENTVNLTRFIKVNKMKYFKQMTSTSLRQGCETFQPKQNNNFLTVVKSLAP
uniref:(northern house mosquito) hypothetical protein n=1 Tax=Culex pipiens TaxID=7175 RepID=A0A8D8ML25_CULPI